METETKEELVKDNIEKTDTENIGKKEAEDKTSQHKKEKKRIRIFGISLWRILAYFILYSVLGFFVETIYGAVTKGLVESRQSFLYGPFCSIYGLGACVMIISLQKFKKSHNRLFIGGFVVGAITEYVVSFLGEMIFHVKWWDYSNRPFNINGRICVAFSVFWGILAMYLLGSLNPKIDKLLDWIKKKVKNEKILKATIIIVFFAMFVDFIVSGIAIKCFEIRKIHDNNINVENIEIINEQYNKVYGNEKISKFIYKYWNDDKMILTFPNLKIKDKEGNMIYFDSLCPGCKRYYLKIYEKYNK